MKRGTGMDIGSKKGYPSSSLSNFSPHKFTIDGVECNSMEGFLQSLKYKNPDMQKYVCTLIGINAKKQGKNKNWKPTQTLWWLGKPYKRDSKEYQDLLDKAYSCLFSQNESFRNALKSTGNATLTHSIGKTDIHQTILTQKEFCSRLTELRNVIKESERE